jgi:hypothetical protein
VVEKMGWGLGKGFLSPLDGNLLLRQQQEIADFSLFQKKGEYEKVFCI